MRDLLFLAYVRVRLFMLKALRPPVFELTELESPWDGRGETALLPAESVFVQGGWGE